MPGTAARGLGGRGREHRQEREDAPVVQRDQPPHRLERRAAVGAQEAVVADLLKAGGQDVLEEAAEELHRVQGHLPGSVRADAAIGEGHLAIVAGDDAMVADRHAEDIRGEVPQRLAAIARGLRMHHPVATPDRGVDQVQQALAPEDVAELGPEDDRQGLRRHEEIGPRRQPAQPSALRPPPGTT